MHINNIHIQNFKGVADWDMSFRPGFNLIKGVNGKGKTSVLEAISVALGGFLSGIPGVRSRNILTEDIRKEYMTVGDGGVAVEYKVPVSIGCNATFRDECNISWIRDRMKAVGPKTVTHPNEIKNYAETLSNGIGYELPLISYYGASRTWAIKEAGRIKENKKNSNHRTKGYEGALQSESNIKNLLSWCEKMERISWQKGEKVSEYEAAKNAISEFMKNMNPGCSYSICYDNQLDGLLYKDKKQICSVSDLSSGYQSLIWMVLDIAYRMAVLNPDKKDKVTKTHGVVLIDELDMHLHPKWQWNVIDSLRKTFPNVQFIASSHSPILFASAKDVWLIDIDHNKVEYVSSHYGIDVNTSMNEYQKTHEMPADVIKIRNKAEEAMDSLDYEEASKWIKKLKKTVDDNSPVVTELSSRMDLELAMMEIE